MAEGSLIFLCPRCFRICEDVPLEEHPHDMIRLDTENLTEAQRKPLFDQNGQMVSRAPLWFLQEIGVVSK